MQKLFHNKVLQKL